MMRIAHIADIHWGLGYPGPNPQSRFDDICRVMDWAADRMIAEQVDLVLVAGDMFRKADVSLEKASREIRAAVAWLRKLTATGIKVLVISGTPSHDPISAYELLKAFELPGVRIVTEMDVIDFETADAGCSVVCIPGMDRSSFANRDEYRGLPAHIMHQMMTDAIEDHCQAFLSEVNYTPAILVGHLTYDLADTGFEDVLMQNEAILTQEAIQGYDLVCLGHIHKGQQNGAVFYSGSPERLSFSDENVKSGFYLHEWTGYEFVSQYVETPARRFITIDWSAIDIQRYINCASEMVKDYDSAIVRLRYSCGEEVNKQVNRRSLEQWLYQQCGAFFVSELSCKVDRIDRARDSEVNESLTPDKALRCWCKGQDISDVETAALVDMTFQIMPGAVA